MTAFFVVLSIAAAAFYAALFVGIIMCLIGFIRFGRW